MYFKPPYDPFDFDDGDGYDLVPVELAWPQVPLMQDPNMRRFYELHPHDATPRAGRKNVPGVIVPGQHGGWRPGAGAPHGNTNAFKTGAHSRRLHRAARLIAQSPQLRDLIAQLAKANQRNQKRRLSTALGVAYEATLNDPASRNSINQILQNGILRRLHQLQTQDQEPNLRQNNQINQAPKSPNRSKARKPSSSGGRGLAEGATPHVADGPATAKLPSPESGEG